MGLNLETLVGILVILILLIMADGLRRMLRERHSSLRMKIEPRRHRDDDDAAEPVEHNPELPSGGARVVQRMLAQRAEQEAADAARQAREAAEADAGDGGRVSPPLVMEPEDVRQAPVSRATQQPLFDDADDAAGEISAPRPAAPTPRPAARPSARSTSAPPPAAEPPRAAIRHDDDADDEAMPALRATREEASAPPAPRATAPREPAPREAARPAARAEPPRMAPDLLEVIVVHLIAPRGSRFDGRLLLEQLLENGLRFGDMNIFHCHRREAGRDVLHFSMANAVEPGTFDIDHMESEAFAGVTFFLKLPGPGKPIAALEGMLETVRRLADALDGELKDEQRSVLTPQTMEHMRQRVQEFERRMRVHQGS
ncbi:cell division protein ZipA [Isoalcanivorax indicus]|uniref:cell division protein ZipA n=1 Tax=Isoalcanivorax indicus TaxID=2202653 RepID=UPI000DBAD790|nr:cell division protein ZipA [Isoalcanivorax indicus]